MALFDENGKLIDQDGLKAINFGKGSRVPRPFVRDGNKVVTVPHEDDGCSAGEQIYKADGRVSANVQLRPIIAQMT